MAINVIRKPLSNSTNTFYIYAPTSDQAQTLAKTIKIGKPQARIVGVTLKGEARDSISRYFDSIEDISDLHDFIKIGTHIPTTARATELLLQNGQVVIGDIIMSQESLKVYDKAWILMKAEEANIPIPRTWYRVEDIASFPIFYKQNTEVGQGIRGYAAGFDDIPKDQMQSLLFQEYIDSPGTYGVGFLAKDGDILAFETHFERISLPITGGSAVIVERFSNDLLKDYTKKILKHISFSGWGLAEFKYCPIKNDYIFMEINAKFWASCELTFNNNKSFGQLLFGLPGFGLKPADRIIFLNRYLRLGVIFAIRNIHYLRSSKLIIHEGLFRSIIIGCIPAIIKKRKWLKKLASF